MSSVLIKGMDMPQNCQKCMDANLNIAISLFGAMCPFCEKIFVADINIRKQRHPSCPLIELPPHGRLIDADKLKSRLVLDNDSNELQRISADILKWIDIQETVIEGSET